MRRTIVQPADLSGAALAELKDWLGISRTPEDALLVGLLQTSLAMCEAFTGQMPLAQIIEERIAARPGCFGLQSRPIIAVSGVELIAPDGTRAALGEADYTVQFTAPGQASIAIGSEHPGQAIAVRIEAGIAQQWEDVPAALRQGMIRLAAFHYRDRDRPGGARGESQPPASVTALWRPWREVRLA